MFGKVAHVLEATDPLAVSNLLLEQRERKARPPTTALSGDGWHTVLSQIDIIHGMESVKIHNEKIARNAGCQSTVENGRFFTTQPKIGQGR